MADFVIFLIMESFIFNITRFVLWDVYTEWMSGTPGRKDKLVNNYKIVN